MSSSIRALQFKLSLAARSGVFSPPVKLLIIGRKRPKVNRSLVYRALRMAVFPGFKLYHGQNLSCLSKGTSVCISRIEFWSIPRSAAYFSVLLTSFFGMSDKIAASDSDILSAKCELQTGMFEIAIAAGMFASAAVMLC